MSNLAPAGTVLCDLADLEATGAKGLNIGEGADRTAIFVVRDGDDVRGYVNSCPHIGVPLEMIDDEFISDFADEIICSTHGARFRIDDGECIAGPCEGQALQPVPVRIEGDKVVMAG